MLSFFTTLPDKGAVPATAARPVFILSFRQRDELAASVALAGWRAVAARRGEGLERRLAASGAAVVVIDARGAVTEGLEAARAIGGSVTAAGRAMLVLVSRNDAGALTDFYDAGATHFLASPMREIELVQALRFADRHARRVSGGWVSEAAAADPLGWRYDHAARSLQLTQALAGAVGLPGGTAPGRALAALDGDVRGLLRDALRRLEAHGTAAFAHDLAGVGRVVQHLQRDARSGRIHALVEPLGSVPDAGAALRDVFPRRSRSIAALAGDLSQALDRGEIEILFQPQVALDTGAIVGVEALSRWHHPRLGEVGAEALLAAAEHGGRSVPLSSYLQNRAFAAAARWPATLAHLRVAVNVAAADIAAPGFVDLLLDRIDTSGLARERVTIEVTEGALIENLAGAASELAVLREAGCRIAIDDFGTGYSSLAYLSALPIDYLKLDRALTRRIVAAPRDRVIVRGVIDMARSLGMAIIAEGVETADQRDALAAEGCAWYQGYLCAPPLDSVALARLVAG
ncbi:EAL domain-containing protein [Sphingomonas donggukensis]|uniref:EAL domain-containing protein n=1 Tax=Sphingomonas donggukensis TaxID=2949093 RepID=A0ABY4TV90_9SPHN|nr:EAL domain-containing protein [Sphingomonas donggukensis]URW76319.1 EAL domain-containing protein [Sphingomonas donggukensis]